MRPHLVKSAPQPFDGPLPQAPEAERACLGAILIDPDVALPRVAAVVGPEDFNNAAHVIVYTTMLELQNDGIAPDIITLKNRLREQGRIAEAGGDVLLSALIDGVPDIARVSHYARIIKAKSNLRRVALLANDGMQRALSGGETAEDIADDLTTGAQLIRPVDALRAILPMKAILPRLEKLYVAGGVERGASTGWPSVDKHFTIARATFTLVTGIPGHGKSNFIDALAVNVARLHGWQVAMFSAENFPPESHIASLIEKYVRLPFNEGPSRRMRPTDVTRGVSFVEKHFRILNPEAEMTLDRVLAAASALCETQHIDLLTIDPWNELVHQRAEGVTETEYINHALSKIRRWVRKHDTHIILVAHPQKMTKDPRAETYPVPTPYSISGSAHWRNQSDYCITVYRDTTNGDSDPNVQVHIQKARRREIGSLGMAMLKYDRVTGEYHDPAEGRS